MRNIILFCIAFLWIAMAGQAQVGINNNESAPEPSAGLDVNFTDKGFLPPRMTRTQMNAITTPAEGLLIFCTDCSSTGEGALVMFLTGAWYSFTPACLTPTIPSEGAHNSAATQIVWNWNPVADATGYKWHTTNNFALASDLGNVTAKSETGLTCFTPYTRFVWSYNNCGNAAPLTLTQTTLPCSGLPTVTTAVPSNIDLTTATGGGDVLSDGGTEVTARGVCWSTSQNPTTSNSITTNGTGTGSFISSMTGLLAGVDYYVRAYATNSSGTSYGAEEIFTTLPFDIGVAYGGGVIFHIDATGQHGLISATTDQSTSAQWGCAGTLIGTSAALGTGQANTTAIVNGCSQAGTAARICNDLVLNGFNDWFLPSKDELLKMHQKLEGVIFFSTNIYRTSTENGPNFAWYLFWGDGQQNYSDKTWGYYVRAIRAF